MTAADRETIENLPFFAPVAASEVAGLLQYSTVQRYPAGTLLFAEGEQPDSLHFVLAGTVEIYSNVNGREWGVMLMNPGDVFLPGAVLFDEPYTTCARTLRSCRLLQIDAERVRAEAGACAPFALQLSRAMAGQFRVAIRQVLDLKSRSAAQRLGSLLLKFADSSTEATAELPMRKRSLAARVGMTPETLSRVLQVLADHGLVVRGRQIIIRDRARIEEFCGPDPYRAPAEDALEVHAL